MQRLALIGAVFVVGCASTRPRVGEGRPPETLAGVRDVVARVVLCETTTSELRAWFGSPMREGRFGTFGIESWLFAKDPERILAVLIDVRQRVVDLVWDAPGVAQWMPHDRCAQE